jgi:hypothetical protein
MVPACRWASGGITFASGKTIPHWICLLPATAVGLRCWSSMHCHAKLAASFISNMMIGQMIGGTCAALRSPPVKLNANPESLHALVDRQGLQRATLTPPHHQILLQTHLQHHPQPPRKGVMRAATGSGNTAGHAYLICISQTRMPGPIGRKKMGKFFCSTRRRRRINTFRPVWSGRTLHLWYIWLMELQDARP